MGCFRMHQWGLRALEKGYRKVQGHLSRSRAHGRRRIFVCPMPCSWARQPVTRFRGWRCVPTRKQRSLAFFGRDYLSEVHSGQSYAVVRHALVGSWWKEPNQTVMTWGIEHMWTNFRNLRMQRWITAINEDRFSCFSCKHFTTSIPHLFEARNMLARPRSTDAEIAISCPCP